MVGSLAMTELGVEWTQVKQHFRCPKCDVRSKNNFLEKFEIGCRGTAVHLWRWSSLRNWQSVSTNREDRTHKTHLPLPRYRVLQIICPEVTYFTGDLTKIFVRV
jgi:hypothetical protein